MRRASAVAAAGFALVVVGPAFADKPAEKKDKKTAAEAPAQVEQEQAQEQEQQGPKEHGKGHGPKGKGESGAPPEAEVPPPVSAGGGPAGDEANAPKKASKAQNEKGPGASEAGRKVTICHATGSAKNPYVRITVSVNSTTGNGHGLHEDDLIPAPAGGCPAPFTGGGGGSGGGGGGNPGGGENPGGGSGHGGGAGGAGGGDPADPPGPVRAPEGLPGLSAAGPSASGQLPFTGVPLGWIVLVGLAFLGAGTALRRRKASWSGRLRAFG